MSISRRGALMGAGAAVAAAGVPRAVQADHPNLSELQALVSDLRNVDTRMPYCVWVAFQETADRLEALPGIEPVPNEMWLRRKAPYGKYGFPEGPYLTMRRA